jgi:hypothetical protein
VAESVELATILLTDLVHSTGLTTSVGAVRADELREERFGLLRDAKRVVVGVGAWHSLGVTLRRSGCLTRWGR